MVKFVRRGLDVKYISDNPAEIKKIESSLKFWVDGCEFSPAYRAHEWDGYHRFYIARTQTFSYGLLHVVQQNLKTAGVQYTTENEFKSIKLPAPLNVDLWAHQKTAVLTFLKHPYGTLKIPTRGGKTHVAAELIRLINAPSTLFIVDSQVLFEQAINDISKYLKIARRDVGQIKGETFEPKAITVAMIQTLQSIKYGLTRLRRRNKDMVKSKRVAAELKVIRREKRARQTQLEKFLSAVAFLIVDEIHEYGSDERLRTVRKAANVQAALFLSATPEKSENLLANLKIKSLGGPIIYTVTEQELKTVGVLAQEDITLVMIDHSKNKNVTMEDAATYTDYKTDVIINNEYRNNILLNIIQMCRQLGLRTLVLFQYIKHAEHIQKITGDTLMTGGTNLKDRMRTVRGHFKKKGQILLASNIFNKGVTLPDVQVMINAAGGLEQSNVTQKKGRTLGVTITKKKAMTIDLIDVSDYFSSHSLSRIEVYENNVGLENINVFDSSDKEFYQDLLEMLSSWKRDV